MITTLHKIFRVMIRALFPNKCISCGDIISEGEWICDYCHEMAEYVDSSKRCLDCGLEKGRCDCEKSVFHFESCVAPFYNCGVIRNAFYSYKLNNKMHYAPFFADKMAFSVKNEFRNINFDGVCYVPASRRSKLKRGFDQCRILAELISERLDIPLLDGEIICNSFSAVQHKLTKDERFANVRGMYSCKSDNTGKIILLVDDIKTTGATLDECARRLLFSGAYEVYCVTALISDHRRKKNGEK